MEHIKTPVHIDAAGRLCDVAGLPICSAAEIADAARAINAHDALVDAVEAVLPFVDGDWDDEAAVRVKAKSALKLAKGE